jgi:lysophospholipase L1-like esterase
MFKPTHLTALLPMLLFVLSISASGSADDNRPINTASVPDQGRAKDAPHLARILDEIAHRKDAIDVVFIGDSIIDYFDKAIWEQDFAPLHAVNFGISGNTTENVLWRLQHGELEGYHAKLFVIMIGTNNARANRPPEVAEAITAITDLILATQPQARILLLGIFPKGAKPNAQRSNNDQVNARIAKLDDGRKIIYRDLGPCFLEADHATLRADLFVDTTHPNAAGYRVWADALLPMVTGLLGSP